MGVKSQVRSHRVLGRSAAMRRGLVGLVAAIILAGASGAAPTAAATPGFYPTGPMALPRDCHTATLMQNGKVLVAGGKGLTPGAPALATAEVYDPQTGKFHLTGSMSVGRMRAFAVALNNGAVLVGGGSDGGAGVLGSAELYHYRAGTFHLTGSLVVPRASASATLLADGRVLVVGGVGTLAQQLTSAEIYDPATGTFSLTGSISRIRYHHTATRLPNGKVLIAGGYDNSTHEVLRSAELYDPATGIFSPTGSMTHERTEHTATLLANGRVLVAGGADWDYALNTAEIYDPVLGTFTATGSFRYVRYGHVASILADGTVMIAGGVDSVRPPARLVPWGELFNPGAGVWRKAGIMAVPRESPTANLLPDGRVLIAGGWIDPGQITNTAEFFWP